MQEVKRVGVMSVTKISTLFGVLAGLIGIIYVWLLSKLPQETLIAMGVPGGVSITFKLVITALLTSIVLYALLGLVIAAIYNLFSKWVGGISLDLAEPRKKKK